MTCSICMTSNYRGVVRVLGVDPGAAQGGLAIVELNDGAAPQLLDAIDLPVAGLGAGARIDVLAVCAWIKHHDPQHAYVERGMAMPRQGASSGYKYGRGVGALEAAIICSGVAMTIIEPSAWKKFHQLRGKNKEQSRLRALQLFPASHALLARKRDHGRAEASLLALYGVRR